MRIPRGLVLFGAICGVLTGMALLAITGGDPESSEEGKENVVPASNQAGDGALLMDELNTVAVFEKVSPSVVYIQNIIERTNPFTMDVMQMEQGTGSGFIWDESGHIVTNANVLKGASRVSLTFRDQSVYEASVVGIEPSKDIAVLHVDSSSEILKPLVLGDSEGLRVGQKVLAIGNPFGLDHTLTTGVVSALHREIRSATGRTITGVIQTDAAIHPGNSGGPLLDSGGRLVGMNTAVLDTDGESLGIGFAVPMTTIAQVVPELIAFGKMRRAAVGGVSFLNDSYVRRRGMTGAVLYRVAPGTSAHRSGLQGMRRDSRGTHFGDILVALEGKQINSAKHLRRQLEEYNPGDEVAVTVVNAGHHRSIRIRLE